MTRGTMATRRSAPTSRVVRLGLVFTDPAQSHSLALRTITVTDLGGYQALLSTPSVIVHIPPCGASPSMLRLRHQETVHHVCR